MQLNPDVIDFHKRIFGSDYPTIERVMFDNPERASEAYQATQSVLADCFPLHAEGVRTIDFEQLAFRIAQLEILAVTR